VSAFQGSILGMFNTHREATFSQISQYSGLDEKELRRALMPLCIAKGGEPMLAKSEPLRKITGAATEKFWVNPKFSHKLTRIKLATTVIKETNVEHAQLVQGVLEDRQWCIDGAIVRIMKRHKTLSHKDLLGKVREKVKFTVNNSDIKRRIENLLQQEYISRNEDNNDVYDYVA